MKTSFLTIIVISIFSLSVNAQHMHGQPSSSQPMREMKKVSSIKKVLPLYYDISNALVNGDANKASSKAFDFVKAINDADMNDFSGKEMDVFMEAQKTLSADGRKLVETKDIEKQRTAFATLSLDLATLIKGAKITFEPVYQITCSMKNATWLSSNTEIKNPYFGKQMLNCGKVTQTLQ